MQVIPVINCGDLRCVTEKIESARTFLRAGDFLHVDVTDGVFTFSKTWNDPKAWRSLRQPFNIEVHLMVEHPQVWITPWLASGAKRFIVPIEAITESSFATIKTLTDEAGAEVMLSSSPETPVENFLLYIKACSLFQILCVHPGFSGQPFLPLTLEKIKWLKANTKNAIIEIDGGMNSETAKMVKDAGADIIVSSSYIFRNGDAMKRYEELKNI